MRLILKLCMCHFQKTENAHWGRLWPMARSFLGLNPSCVLLHDILTLHSIHVNTLTKAMDMSRDDLKLLTNYKTNQLHVNNNHILP